MKRKAGFLFGVLGFVLVLLGVIRIFGTRSSKQGVLKVESTPQASVFLDNKHIGRTPFEERVEIGEHTIKIVPDTAADAIGSWQSKTTVSANRLTYIRVDLSQSELTSASDVLWLEKSSSKAPEISIVSNPDGATVMVDDLTRGITPLVIQDVPAGDHTLTITSSGFLTRTLKIQTTEGYKLNAMVKLALAPGGGVEKQEIVPESTSSATQIDAQEDGRIPERPSIRILDTPTGFLRVRLGPTTSATEAAQVDPGDIYVLIDEENGWYQIEYEENALGWVSGRYAEKIDE